MGRAANILHKNAITTSVETSEGVCTKFSNGEMICRHNVTINTAITIPLNTWYRTSVGFLVWNFPIRFVEPPQVSVGIRYNGIADIVLLPAYSSLCTEEQFTPVFGSPTSQTKELSFDFIAFGKWK